MSTEHGVDQFVQLRQELGAILRGHGCRAAPDNSVLAEAVEQVAHGERFADVVFGEDSAFRVEHAGLLRDAACGQWDVGGDDDVVGAGLLGNPVVDDVESRFVTHDEFDQRVGRDSQRGVGDDNDAQRVAFRDSIDFVLHRAGVCVHEEGQHVGVFLCSHHRSA